VALAASHFAGTPRRPGRSFRLSRPSPKRVIRLERVRDNPSNFGIRSGCGVTAAIVRRIPSDYWPNASMTHGKGTTASPHPPQHQVTLGGIMNYVELDVKNLAKWFNGHHRCLPGAHHPPSVAPNNFVVYISDRRGNFLPRGRPSAAWPPSRPPRTRPGKLDLLTLVNSGDIKGCPDNEDRAIPAPGDFS